VGDGTTVVFRAAASTLFYLTTTRWWSMIFGIFLYQNVHTLICAM